MRVLDPEPDEAYRTETRADGTFSLTFEHEGSIDDYALIAEPGSTPAARGAQSDRQEDTDPRFLSSSTALVEKDAAVISPLTTLITEQLQVSERDPEHLERRLAAALGAGAGGRADAAFPVDTEFAVDYRGGVDPITGNARKGLPDLARGLDQVLLTLHERIDTVSDGRWTDNPGARRNLVADRAFYYAGAIAEGEIGGALGLEELRFETALYDVDLAGGTRERLQGLSEEGDTSPDRGYPLAPYALAIGDGALAWRALRFERDEGGESVAYELGGQEPVAEVETLEELEPEGRTYELPRPDNARGVTCELDAPLQVSLSYAADAPWPTYYLLGEERWRTHTLSGLDLRSDQTFGRRPERYLYYGGFSCSSEGAG